MTPVGSYRCHPTSLSLLPSSTGAGATLRGACAYKPTLEDSPSLRHLEGASIHGQDRAGLPTQIQVNLY